MQNNTFQQILINYHKEFSQITIPEDAVTFTLPATDVLKLGEVKGIPLINLCPLKVKATDFFVTLKQVARVIKKFKPDLSAEIAHIEAALPVDPAEQELFVSQAFTPGANLLTDLKQDFSPETFGLLLNHTIKPFMQQYGQKVGSLYDFELWLRGNCPVCGGRPSLALLEKETGKRSLYCGLCEIKWRFQRLGCPYCLNNESHFFTVEGMEQYRVYFCEKCHGYIKTINEEKTDGKVINLFWEDLNTVQLDILAMREGYFNEQVSLPLKDTEK